MLQDAGFPIYDDKAPNGQQGLWRVHEEFKQKLPLKLKLSLAELAALLMSRQLLAPAGASLLGPAVTSAFDKITGVLSRDALQVIDRMRDTVGVRAFGAKVRLPATEHLPAIQDALVEHRGLRVRYYSFQRDEETKREVDPYHLRISMEGSTSSATATCGAPFASSRWNAFAAWTCWAAGSRCPWASDPEKYLAGALGIISGDLVTVKIVFATKLARYIRERLWHPSQKFRDLTDGRLELTLHVADTLEVRRWILGYGVQAEVIEPAGMREALRQEAEALADRLAPQRKPLAAAGAARAQQRSARRSPYRK